MLLSSYVAKPELLCKYTKKPLKKYVDNFKLIHIKKYLSTKKPQMIQVCGFTKHYENHCLNTK